MHGLGIGVAQVPDKTMHARPFRRRLRMRNPIFGDVQRLLVSLRQRRAGVGADQFSILVVDLQLEIRGRCRWEKIIEDGAVGRILPGGNFRAAAACPDSRRGAPGPRAAA